jgi:hypothetical protein
VLWLLIGLAALGGLTSWVRPDAGSAVDPPVAGSPAGDQSWAAAGFGARFVAVYLATGPADGTLGSFLGYESDLQRTGPASPEVPDVSVVDLEPVDGGYWAVTVAATTSRGEGFWRVGVAARDGGFVVAALPTPVAAPAAAGDPVELATAAMKAPDPNGPDVQAVAGFVAAYLCGDGDLSRYLAPGVVLEPLGAQCDEVEVDRWGSSPLADGQQVVLSEVLLDPGLNGRRVTLPLVLARRGDRWEIKQLLVAPAIAASSDGGAEVVG